MARYLPQEAFDTLMISHAMLRVAPKVDEDAHFATQCYLSLKIHGADDHQAVLRAPDKLLPLIEDCVGHLCSEFFVGRGKHAPEHKIAVLHDLHEKHRHPFQESIADSSERPRRQVSNARIDQSAANIRTATDILRMKTRLRRLASE